MTSSLTPAKRFGLGRPRPSLRTNFDDHAIPSSPPPPPPPPPSHALASAVSREMLSRKTSYNQLTQNSLASIPDSSAVYGLRQAGAGAGGGSGRAGDVEVGDLVNTPGGMYGTVKFIGSVKGKGGVFVGVELEGELAGRGKNDGAVDG